MARQSSSARTGPTGLRLLAGLAVALQCLLLTAPGLRADTKCPSHWQGLTAGRAVDGYDLSEIWDTFDAPLIETQGGIAFTDTPGVFLVINCTDNQPRPTEYQEFYPIGMLLKPLRVLDLDTNETDTFVDSRTGMTLEVPRTYLLVLTEFGHLKIIRESDVQYMVSGATYFFADSNTRIFLCGDEADCPGNQRQVSLPDGTYAPSCDQARCRDYTAIDPMGGYAVGAIPATWEGRARNDWSTVFAARRLIRERRLANVDAATVEDACRPFRVKSYQKGGSPRLLSDREEFLTLCGKRGVIQKPPLRDMTKSQAIALFDDMAEGIFFRWFGSPEATLRGIITPGSRLGQVGQKGCSETLTSGTATEASITAGGGFSLWGLLSLSAKTELAASSAFTSEYAGDEFLRLSNFVAPGFVGAGWSSIDEGLTLDMLFVAGCEGTSIGDPRAVILEHPVFDSAVMEIRTRDLTNLYDRIFSLEGAPLPGFDNQGTADAIRAGRFYTIHDVDTYYRWKTTIGELLKTGSLAGFLDGLEDRGRRDAVHDFFTHLLMAALFRYEIEVETQFTEQF